MTTRTKLRLAAVGAVVLGLLACVGAWQFRWQLSWFFPIEHTGTVMRIGQFHKGGIVGRAEGTRQLNQFAIFFDDGFDCEGTDTSFAAVREGDRITLRGYHDVRGWPFADPEWFECDEAQLIRLFPGEPADGAPKAEPTKP